jgi:hypothetical protein
VAVRVIRIASFRQTEITADLWAILWAISSDVNDR